MLTYTLLSFRPSNGGVSALRAYKPLRVPLAWRGETKNSCRKNQLKNSITGTKGARGAPALESVLNGMPL